MTYYNLLSNKADCLTLNKLLYHSPKLFHFLISSFNSKKEILSNMSVIKQKFISKSANSLETIPTLSTQKDEDFLKEKNIHLLTLNDPDYPEYLKEIHYPPPVLFFQGNIACLKKPMLGIVGTRKPSQYGTHTTQQFTKKLCQYFTIISGFAEGIDTIAHETCVNQKESTAAIMGVGLDKLYPQENSLLAEKIIKTNGCLISEIPLFKAPERYHFPLRNRIISGLSKGVLIVEGKQKSGSLITANYALEQNREIFSIPGNISEETSSGTNNLIKQGAKCTTCPEDIFDELNINIQAKTHSSTPLFENFEKQPNKKNLSETEVTILNSLTTSKHIDEIISETNLPLHDVLHQLTFLEINHHIKKTSNNNYVAL